MYQLVVQFDGTSTDDFDRLLEIERLLIDRLPPPAEVDGHDFGSGEMNIFVIAEEPIGTFSEAKRIIALVWPDLSSIRAAYRELSSDEFTVLWPHESAEFTVA